jgi:hypothetical protein
MVQHVERKAISPGTTNLLHSLHYHDYTYSQLSVPCVEWGIPSRFPENLFLYYPVITSTSCLTHYPRVEYTTHRVHQFGYARLEQIHIHFY